MSLMTAPEFIFCKTRNFHTMTFILSPDHSLLTSHKKCLCVSRSSYGSNSDSDSKSFSLVLTNKAMDLALFDFVDVTWSVAGDVASDVGDSKLNLDIVQLCVTTHTKRSSSPF